MRVRRLIGLATLVLFSLNSASGAQVVTPPTEVAPGLQVTRPPALSAPNQPALSPQSLQRLDVPATRRMSLVLSPPRLTSVRDEIRRSSLYLAEIDAAAVASARQDVVVALSSEVRVNLSALVRETDLAASTGLDGLSPQAAQSLLGGTPTFNTAIFALEDRLVVVREALVPFSAATCRSEPRRTRRPMLRQFLDKECFSLAPRETWADARLPAGRDRVFRTDGPEGEAAALAEINVASEFQAEIADIRAELAGAPSDAEWLPGLTVAAARGLSDEALLDVELNGSPRLIIQTSVLPYGPRVAAPSATRPQGPGPLGQFLVSVDPDIARTAPPPAPLSSQLRNYLIQTSPRLQAYDARIQTRLTQEQLGRGRLTFDAPANPLDAPTANRSTLADGTRDLPRLDARRRTGEILDERYRTLLMGRTVLQHFGDDYRVSFGRNGRWHVGFEWWAGYGYGLRFPFELAMSSRETFRSGATISARAEPPLYTEALNVDVSVAGIARTRDGRSPYVDAGLPERLRAGDAELFLAAYAGCRLYGRVPIAGSFGVRCPSFSVPEGCGPNGCSPSPEECRDSPFCENFTPRLQSRPWRLGDITVPASIHGLELNAGILRAGVDPGIEALAIDTRLSLLAEAVSGEFPSAGRGSCRGLDHMQANTLVGPGACRLVFAQQDVPRMQLAVVPDAGRDASLRLTDPRLDLTVGLAPFMELYVVFDLKVWSKRWDWRLHLGRFDIAAAFDAHDGTPSRFEVGECDFGSPIVGDCRGVQRQISDVPG
jgi:hypothetical protein